jgi:hypothetical protein
MDASHFVRAFIRTSTGYLIRFIRNRELKFVGAILVLYSVLVSVLYVLLWQKLLQIDHFVAGTVIASCITVSLSQIAFLARATSLEGALQFKGLLVALFEGARFEDVRIKGYINVGEQTVQILQTSKSKAGDDKQVSEAYLHFSNVALKNCQTELKDILAEKQIRRSGKLAFELTQECYKFAQTEISAVALVSDGSLAFWEDDQGTAKYFYQSNADALSRNVGINRYFLFTRDDIARLTRDPKYRARTLSALATYLSKLGGSDMYLAFRAESWHRVFPTVNSMPHHDFERNKRFKSLYKDDSFPDVSIFDKSVASLWQRPSNETIDEVCIAWESSDVSSVKYLFKQVFVNPQRLSVVLKRGKADDLTDMLDVFLSQVRAVLVQADEQAAAGQ